MSEPVEIRCRDLAFHADLLLDLGIPDGSFGHHDTTGLDEPCYCEEQSQFQRGEDRRRCDNPLTIVRPGFHAELCCRCADAEDDVLEEACRRVAGAIAAVGRPSPTAFAAFRRHRRRGLSPTAAQLAVSGGVR